jgi:3-dehydroquinate synthase
MSSSATTLRTTSEDAAAGLNTEAKITRMGTQETMKRIRVHLDKRSYDILVSYGWLDKLGQKLKSWGLSGDAMVFTSPRIGGLYFDKLAASLRAAGFNQVVRHDIPDGEKNKNHAQYMRCINTLSSNFPDPGAVPIVVNLGGGVVGDIGGYAAANFNRGIPYVQVPTSLLGCVDCGVGGKVGINYDGVKNKIGSFYQPRLVFADLALLETLDAREIRSGTAEVIKYGMVCSKPLFEYLEKNIEKLLALDSAVLTKVVADSYHIKARIVEKDERDNNGLRMVLNFGHTIGHAIEMAATYRMTHGEAISVGMIAASRMAVELNVCKVVLHDRLRSLIERAGLPTSARGQRVSLERVMKNMAKDKKFADGKNCFILPSGVGKWVARTGVDNHLIVEVVRDCLRA